MTTPVVAVAAPGQGSQTPGMLAPWLEAGGSTSRERLGRWSELTGLDLVALGTTAGAEEITDTAVTQPLVVASALLAGAQLREAFAAVPERGVRPVLAGHSVGEIAALALAGVLSEDDAVWLAGVRGRAMAAACTETSTGMSAVLGGVEEEVLAHLSELGLTPANRNAVGQIVAAGPREALTELASAPPARARVTPLPVAGAFHTEFMASAAEAVREAAATLTPADPTVTLLSNRDGAPVASGDQALERVVEQLTRPVRWDLCCAWLREAGVEVFMELPPAKALSGIARRELKGVERVVLNLPEQLEEARRNLGLDK